MELSLRLSVFSSVSEMSTALAFWNACSDKNRRIINHSKTEGVKQLLMAM